MPWHDRKALLALTASWRCEGHQLPRTCSLLKSKQASRAGAVCPACHESHVPLTLNPLHPEARTLTCSAVEQRVAVQALVLCAPLHKAVRATLALLQRARLHAVHEREPAVGARVDRTAEHRVQLALARPMLALDLASGAVVPGVAPGDVFNGGNGVVAGLEDALVVQRGQALERELNAVRAQRFACGLLGVVSAGRGKGTGC